MHRVLVILNDAPYGSERSYDGMRLAVSMARREGVEVRVFLMGDAVFCAKSGQITPRGSYNIESMFKPVLGNRGRVAACGTCMERRAASPGRCWSRTSARAPWTSSVTGRSGPTIS